MSRVRNRRPKEVFLSHSVRDAVFVKRLAGSLRGARLRCWYSGRHIVGASQWQDAIGKALRRCDWFVIVLSPSSVESEWVKRELSYALGHSRYGNRIVPLLLRACKPDHLSWVLSTLQRVDFTKGFDRGLRDLLRIWRMPSP